MFNTLHNILILKATLNISLEYYRIVFRKATEIGAKVQRVLDHARIYKKFKNIEHAQNAIKYF